MSAESRSMPAGSQFARVIFLMAIAACIVGMQIALPLFSIYWAGEELDEQQVQPYYWSNEFWAARMRFARFLKPDYYQGPRVDDAPLRHVFSPFLGTGSSNLRSMTVSNEELIFVARSKYTAKPDQPTEVIRFNLRTGRSWTSSMPDGIGCVVSDGANVRWLPADLQRGDQWKWMIDEAWIWDGVPTSLVHAPKSRQLRQFVQFIDGRWQERDRYLLLPMNVEIHPQQSTSYEDTHLLIGGDDDDAIYYRTGLQIGSRDEAERFAEQNSFEFNGYLWPERSGPQLEQLGFHRVPIPSDPNFGPHPFGRWFESGIPCAMDYYNNPDGGEAHGYLWRRFEAGQPIDSKFIPTPVAWGQSSRDIYNGGGQLHAVAGANGQVYILSIDSRDARMHVLRWEHGTLRVVAQRGSPLILWVCLDGCLFFGMACIGPMLLLGAVAFAAQWFYGTRTFSYGSETVVLASAVRRGIARSIDLVISGSPLALSVVAHPDVMGWWREFMGRVRDLINEVTYFEFSSPSDCYQRLQSCLSTFATVPVVGWLLIAAVLVTIAQITWQARTGDTIGKRLVGIRTVRTTLEPCGFARSLLRELILVFDSVMLISWIPGVISILATSRSQRVGDSMTDTIVIRDSSHDWFRRLRNKYGHSCAQ